MAQSNMTILEKATAATAKKGFYLMLTQNRGGKWAWTALALGDHPEMTPSGALYTRASATGKTAEDALAALIDILEKPKKKTVEELFG